jgi:aldose 1-epimerase
MSWTRIAHEPDEVTLRCAPVGQIGYPFAVQNDVTYRLDARDGLHVTVTAVNKGGRPAPWGTGQHPYLAVATPSVDETELTLPADKWLQADDRGIPAGPARDVAGTEFDFRVPRKVAGTVLDHAFTGLRRAADGLAWVRLGGGGAGSALWADDGYRWLQVFTGDPLESAMRRTALAVEPMTCPPNAFASGEDLLVLGPGKSVSCRWGIQS